MNIFGGIVPEGLAGVETLLVPVAHQRFFIVSFADLFDIGHRFNSECITYLYLSKRLNEVLNSLIIN